MDNLDRVALLFFLLIAAVGLIAHLRDRATRKRPMATRRQPDPRDVMAQHWRIVGRK